MRVQMVVARSLQHAGAERPLSTGEVYELPDVVARALLESGDAVVVPVGPQETKPDPTPLDVKRKR